MDSTAANVGDGWTRDRPVSGVDLRITDIRIGGEPRGHYNRYWKLADPGRRYKELWNNDVEVDRRKMRVVSYPKPKRLLIKHTSAFADPSRPEAPILLTFQSVHFAFGFNASQAATPIETRQIFR